jgi:hypothetical protein
MLVSVAAAICGADEPRKLEKLPVLGDETPLVKIKANPGDYTHKPAIICGGLKISDEYVGPYKFKVMVEKFYSLLFVEFKATDTSKVGDYAHLYLAKSSYSRPIIDSIAKLQAKEFKGSLAARVQVCVNPAIIEHYTDPWRTMEVLDVQFPEKGGKGWEPWIIADRVSKERAEAAKQDAEREKEARERTAQIEKLREAERQAKAPKFRTWTITDDDGEREITAKYKSRAMDKVKLELEEGTVISVPFDRLSEEDQKYVKGRAAIRRK